MRGLLLILEGNGWGLGDEELVSVDSERESVRERRRERRGGTCSIVRMEEHQYCAEFGHVTEPFAETRDRNSISVPLTPHKTLVHQCPAHHEASLASERSFANEKHLNISTQF